MTGESKYGFIPLLGHEVALDDNGCAFVLVFPREESLGGTVNADQFIETPLKDAWQIFARRRNDASYLTMKRHGFGTLPLGRLRCGSYQAIMRDTILHALVSAGLTLEAFHSLDSDETFLKIYLDPKGDVIKKLAQRYRYRIAFKRECYKDMPAEGLDFQGGRPMCDSFGYEVLSYTEFDLELQEYLSDFRHIDVIRIVHMCLDEWLNLEEMVRQNIIVRYFPAASFEEMLSIHRTWGGFKNLASFPNHDHEEKLKDYLGEMSAFFFRFFCYYVRALIPLAFIGGLCTLRRFLGLSLDRQRYVQIAFAFILVGWAALFTAIFDARSRSAVRRWGMKDWGLNCPMDRSNYDLSLEGTWRQSLQRSFSEIFVFLFCAFFAATLVGMETYFAVQREHGDTTVEKWGSTMTVVLIRVVSLLWGKLAPWLVNLQNHRTEKDHTTALTWILASVKLFVALFPFVNTAFLRKHFEPTCGSSLEEAAWKVYGRAVSWPTGISHSSPMREWPNGKAYLAQPGGLDFLQGFWHETQDGQICIYGCYPMHCEGNNACVTNCFERLEKDLFVVYVVHVACTVLFSLVIPIILAKISVVREYRKVMNGPGTENKMYTLLQFQAKCSEVASYEYDSWGGSNVDDFMELAIGFALMTCFGIALPFMTVLGLLSHLVEYRLLAYRMTNVTCRPIPHGADGIGIWLSVFEHISEAAIVINVAMAVFCMHPMREWEFRHQLAAFLTLEHLMILMRKMVMISIDKDPAEAKRIDDFNTRCVSVVLQKTKRYSTITIPQRLQQDISTIDLSLGPTSHNYAVHKGINFDPL